MQLANFTDCLKAAQSKVYPQAAQRLSCRLKPKGGLHIKKAAANPSNKSGELEARGDEEAFPRESKYRAQRWPISLSISLLAVFFASRRQLSLI